MAVPPSKPTLRESSMRTLIAAVAATLLILPNALAQEPTPADASVLPEPVAVEGSVIEEGAVYADAIECCPICVSNHRIGLSARRAYRCQSSVPVTMCVKNPADCCHYAVEFCLPCCCVGEARLCRRVWPVGSWRYDLPVGLWPVCEGHLPRPRRRGHPLHDVSQSPCEPA